mmetsp:Transcript_10150/g.26083  ORF Transcript_10150/g.26083 Transcript_10150/m.26083 type:complete len:295 (-) Transcript_10150:301-1185(-)
MSGDLGQGLLQLVPGDGPVVVPVEGFEEPTALFVVHILQAGIRQRLAHPLLAHDLLELLAVDAERPLPLLRQTQAVQELLELVGFRLLLILVLVAGLLHFVRHQTGEQREHPEGTHHDVPNPEKLHVRVHFVDHPRRRGPIVARQEDAQGFHGSPHGSEPTLDLLRILEVVIAVANHAGDEDGRCEHQGQKHHGDPENARQRVNEAIGEQPERLQMLKYPHGAKHPQQPDNSQCRDDVGYLRVAFVSGQTKHALVHHAKTDDSKVEPIPTFVFVDEEIAAINHQTQDELDTENT